MTLWGGRFEGDASRATWEFTTDNSDRRLLEVDLEGSVAHVRMLGATGVIPADEAGTLSNGLHEILEEARSGVFVFFEGDEDVHTAVERRLGEIVGDVAGKLHTGRSRNDQVALDLRLYLSRSGGERIGQLEALIASLANLAEEHADTVVASYTHLQQAQVTTLGHHLLAYAWMMLREVARFREAISRMAVSPLGAGASAGSSLPLDREMVAADLGMSGIMPNSLDAVASRDFVSEYVFCCAQTMVELSRLAEEIVLWASQEFGWARLGDEVSTGSSALPHKRNPDIAELVRGRAATVSGDLAAVMTLQKGLPLAYNRDLQEDKRIVFHADDALAGSLEAMRVLLEGIDFDPPPPSAETVALDLAEALVRKGVPFREAHHVVGRLVVRMEGRGLALSDATGDDLDIVDGRFEEADLALLDPARSLKHRRTEGSGNTESVLAQVLTIREILA